MAADPIWASVNADGTFVSPKIQAAIDARTKATMRADLPTLAEELKIGGAMPEGGEPGQVLTTGPDGTAAWAPAPKGDAGRGIKSIVSSTSDPTKATVTYTDNTTEVITLPTGAPGAAGKSIKSFGDPDGEGVSVVTFSDGTTTTITLPIGNITQNLAWSKDAQAKAQGYWIVVSPTEPASATYTTADGTTVPVIWQKPVEQVVPVAPEEPFWGKGDTTITVAKLVGVDYKITAFIKDGVSTPANVAIPEAQAFKLATAPGAPQLPFSVQIEAVAEPGYRMLGKYQWTTLYLDPTGLNLMTSDGFSGEDGTNMVGRPTDVYAGGTPAVWRNYESSADPNPTFQVQGGKLSVDPARTTTTKPFSGIWLDAKAKNMHVAFDLNYTPGGNLYMEMGLGGTGPSAFGGTTFRIVGSDFQYRTPTMTSQASLANRPNPLPSGRYVFEQVKETVAVTLPGGTRRIISVADPSASLGTWFYIRANGKGSTDIPYTIDNLVISSVGVA